MQRRVLLAAVAGLGLLQTMAWANVKLPAIIGDNMALQAGKPVPIWGTADAGEKVTVELGTQKVTTVAGENGKWMVKLAPLTAGNVGEMKVTGNNALVVKNILAGSVWVCSGQSNMEFTMKSAHNVATEIPLAKYPNMRLFTVAKKIAYEPMSDCVGKWVECTPETAPGFSAVGYFFGRDVHTATGLPVGMIHTSWGGTVAQAWTSLDGLDKNAEMKKAFGDNFRQTAAGMAGLKEKYNNEVLPKYQQQVEKWKETEKEAKAAGKPVPPAPRRPLAPDQNPNVPTVLYDGMLAPVIPYAIEGAIWYQGESNAGNPVQYRTLFPLMISDWREKWGQGDFPFYFVQLANFQARETVPSASNWAMLREAQTMTLALPNTGMAVIIDIGQGDNIHPRDKMDVGHRLALWALNKVFNKDVVYTGPLYDTMKVEDGKIRVSFKKEGGSLMISAAPSTQPGVKAEAPLHELKGFAIAGEDKKFVWAEAKIEGDSVVVWSDAVSKPVAVRYAWGNNPECNLYNKQGLPASPFRTDNWEK